MVASSRRLATVYLVYILVLCDSSTQAGDVVVPQRGRGGRP